MEKNQFVQILNFNLSVREKLNDMVKRELQQEHIEKIKKMKEKKIHDQIQEKIKYDPKEKSKSFEREARKKR